jgi:hypothetical protein
MLMVADHQDWKSNSELFGLELLFPCRTRTIPAELRGSCSA